MDDIKDFFSGFNVQNNQVKIGTNPDGSKTGEGAVIFSDEEEARRAYKERQGRNIGHRYIELFVMSNGDYQDFEKIQTFSRKTVKLMGQVQPGERNKAIKVRGLPYSVTEDDISFLFKEFKVRNSDVIIEQFNGKKTGYALIFFSSEKDASYAKKNYNGAMIGNRYIEILSVGEKDIAY
eukprot:CAMPEP_0202956076 /NCGR_PEP_ID=MMETSP1396-20130829/633_1 /ASSEMBLY_ACC=CAM_ASM_000872 /TAXON_ID= /ORGANISM="Pseudokeronopsis sp., Strain Brazil" /LENGTH=178 /DNA_ID=CAMNT_0049672943 /DNA_START=367 /DNA_END=903 /DNA_ORIENTATION=+